MGRFATLCALAALALAVAASGGAAAPPARAPLLGVVPHASATSAFGRHGLSGNPTGPLFLQESPCTLTSSPEPCWTMRTNTTYAIYWVPSGFSVDTNYESLIDRYLTDVAAASGSLTNVYSVAMQYYDSLAAIHYQSTFGGSYVDTSPFPPSGCDDGKDSVCLTDQQLQNEIQRVLTLEGWHAGTESMFFLMTPKSVGSCFDGSDTECTTNTYCAYHSGFVGSDAQPVLYANEPYAATIPACSSGSSPNGDDADSTINTISHEHNEAITDPWGDAWLNATGDGENGDICAWTWGTPLGGTPGSQYNQVINGNHYWLQEEYSNDGNACLQHYTPTVAPGTFAPPVVSGIPAQGQTLSTSEGSWTHAPSGYSYQWQRCAADGTGCVDIPGATGTSFQVSSSDMGHALRSEVDAQNAAGSGGFVASAPTQVVAGIPSSTGSPVVSGVAAVGKKLTATPGSWNTTATFAYQWLRCATAGSPCTTIAGASAATYVAGAADAGHRLEVSVSATNVVGTGQALSRQSGVVIDLPHLRKAPHISGRVRVGQRLAAGRGTWTGPPKSYRYQWLRCNAHGGSCRRIRHATHSRYRLTKLDASHRLRVRVTAFNAAGSRTAISRATLRAPAAR